MLQPESLIGPKDAACLTSEHPDVIAAAAESYKSIADRENLDPKKIHRMDLCAWITRPLRLSLERQGYIFRPFGRQLEHSGPHVYLRGETSRGLVLVDGTWQQFLPRWKRHPDLPKTIVGTPDEVVTFAKDAGVRTKNLDYWRRRRTIRVIDEVDEAFSFGLID